MVGVDPTPAIIAATNDMSAAARVLQVDRCNKIHQFYRKTMKTEWSPAWEINRLVV